MTEILAFKLIGVYWWHWLAISLCCITPMCSISARATAWLYSGAFFFAQLFIHAKELDGQNFFLFAAAAELAICSIAIFTNNRPAKIIATWSLVAAAFHAGIALEYSYPDHFNLYAHRWIISLAEWGQIFALIVFSKPVYQWQLNRDLKKERAKEDIWTVYWALR